MNSGVTEKPRVHWGFSGSALESVGGVFGSFAGSNPVARSTRRFRLLGTCACWRTGTRLGRMRPRPRAWFLARSRSRGARLLPSGRLRAPRTKARRSLSPRSRGRRVAHRPLRGLCAAAGHRTGGPDNFFGSTDHVIRCIAVAAGGLLAIWAARVRILAQRRTLESEERLQASRTAPTECCWSMGMASSAPFPRQEG